MDYPKSIWWQSPLLGALIVAPLSVVSSSVIMQGTLIVAPSGIIAQSSLYIGAFCGIFYGIICAANRLQFLASALWSGFFNLAVSLTMATIAYRFLNNGHTWQGDLPYNILMIVIDMLTATGGGYLLALLVRIWNEEIARPRKAVQGSGAAAGRARPAVYEL